MSWLCLILLCSQWCRPSRPPRPMACQWGAWHLTPLPVLAATAAVSRPSAAAASLKRVGSTSRRLTLLCPPPFPWTCPFGEAARLLLPTASTNGTIPGERRHCLTVYQCRPVPTTPAWPRNPNWTAHSELIPNRATGPPRGRSLSCSVSAVNANWD